MTIPVKAGSHMVGATFLATNYRPSLDMIRQYERKSLENNSIPQLQYYPAIGFLRIQGPFNATRPEDSRSIRKVFTCRPASAAQEEPCAQEILTTLTRRAYRRPATPQDLEWVWGFYQEGRREGTFEDGIELALRRILTSPQFLVRAEKEPANAKPGQPYRITDLELASRLSFLLWSSIPDDELINVASQNKLHTPAGARAAGAAHARRSPVRGAGRKLRRSVAVPAESARDFAGRRVLSQLGRRAAQELPARDGTAL